jgi:hypothetical protein
MYAAHKVGRANEPTKPAEQRKQVLYTALRAFTDADVVQLYLLYLLLDHDVTILGNQLFFGRDELDENSEAYSGGR